jgi:hypothetical protein
MSCERHRAAARSQSSTCYAGGMADRELLEWLFYATVGLCALVAHNLLASLR